jgi:hypothetical protein
MAVTLECNTAIIQSNSFQYDIQARRNKKGQ